MQIVKLVKVSESGKNSEPSETSGETLGEQLLSELTISMITLKKCFKTIFTQVYKRWKEGRVTKYLVLEEVWVFLWIYFFLLLDRMFWRAKGSHWAYPTPARTWKIGCHLVKFSSHPKKCGRQEQIWIFYLTCWSISMQLINIPQ